MPPSSNDQNNGWFAYPSGTCCLKGTIAKALRVGFIMATGLETYIMEPKKATQMVTYYFQSTGLGVQTIPNQFEIINNPRGPKPSICGGLRSRFDNWGRKIGR